MQPQKVQWQIVLFYSKEYSNNSYEVFSLILKSALGDSLSTLQLPIPDNIPNEVPRLVLQYDGYSINVAKNRCEIIIQKSDIILNGTLERFLNIDFSSLNIQFNRVGVIKTYFKKAQIEELKKLLNSELASQDITEISIRINRPDNRHEIPCNNVEKLDMGKAQITNNGLPTTQDGIIIIKDLNTNPIRKEDIPIATIKDLVNEMLADDNFILLS